MENNKPKQAQRVLDYMEKYGSITPLQAINELGILRLAAVISVLKKRGLCIESEFVSVRNRYGETCRVKQYSLGGDDIG
jgi:hypothetical protein